LLAEGTAMFWIIGNYIWCSVASLRIGAPAAEDPTPPIPFGCR